MLSQFNALSDVSTGSRSCAETDGQSSATLLMISARIIVLICSRVTSATIAISRNNGTVEQKTVSTRKAEVPERSEVCLIQGSRERGQSSVLVGRLCPS